jgi:hypothetical protein
MRKTKRPLNLQPRDIFGDQASSFPLLKPAVDAIYAPTVPDCFTGPAVSVSRFRRGGALAGFLGSLGRNVREELRNRKALRRRESRTLRFHFAAFKGGQNRFPGHFVQHSLQGGVRFVAGPVAGLAALDKKKLPVNSLPPGIRAHQKQKQHRRKAEQHVRPI